MHGYVRSHKGMKFTIAAIIFFLARWNVLLPSVLGFLPNARMNYFLHIGTFRLTLNIKTVTHADMTKNAILKVFRRLADDNPNSNKYGSSQRITQLGQGNDVSSIEINLNKVIKSITIANANVDLTSEEEKLAEAHFDAEQFEDGQNRLIMLRQNAVILIKNKNYKLARQETGRMLHTLQDFYSHSNWLENGNLDIYRVLGRVNQTPLPIADPNSQTCTDCEEIGTISSIVGWFNTKMAGSSAKKVYRCSDNLHSSLKRKGLLTSGYYSGSHDRNNIPIKKQGGKCSHGGFLDSTSDSYAKGGINKDSLIEKWSPHYKQHIEAAKMAEHATVDMLLEMRKDVNDDDLFAEFLGVPTISASVSIAFTGGTTQSMSKELSVTITQIKENLKQYAKLYGNENIHYILIPFSPSGI